MKRIMIFVVLALVALATSAQAEWKWQHFGTDPYATSREVAMKTREDAFRSMGLPAPVITQLLRVTEKSGEKVRIVNGDHFSVMLSKKGVHRDVVVAWEKKPQRAMEYAAPAEKWQTVWEGKTFIVFLPEVCFNWAFTVATIIAPRAVVAPVVFAEKCVELSFNAPVGGKVRWGVASATGPLPPSECNAQRQDDQPWTAWMGQCDDCVGAIGYLRGILGEKAEIQHKYLYAVTAKEQTLRFSEAVWADVVYICLEYPDGKMTCGVYMRPQDWQGRHSVFIKDSFWVSDANCPQ